MNVKVGGETEIDTDELEEAVFGQMKTVDQAAADLIGDDESESSQAEDPVEKDLILVYKPKCLECTHLFPEGKKPYNNCHFSAGNEDCPARTLKIVVMVPAERVSDLMVEATLSNDVVRLAELSARLNKKDPAEIERVMKLFREKVAAVQ